MGVDDQSLDCLEIFHAGSAKLFQGLLMQICSTSSVGTIGWSSIKAKVDILRMLLLWQYVDITNDM